MRASGADYFFLDDGAIAATVQRAWEGGADKVLELVGTTTLADSLATVREPGIVCMSGMVGNRWALVDFAPMDVIPTGVSLTTYSGDVQDFLAMPLQELLDQVADGVLPVGIGRVFGLDDIVEAHRTMESNTARGKLVIVTHQESRPA